MQLFFVLAYIVIGFVQMFAIIDGIKYATGIGGFFATIFALLTTYVPLLGTLLGIYGAVNAWGLSILQAILFFFWPILLMVPLLLFAGFGRR